MTASNASSSSRSFLRELVGWLPLLLIIGASLVGYRVWNNELKQSPVAAVHAGFLDFMAERSPKASAYRSAYYRKFERESIASMHFEQVCAVMYRSAVDDGVDLAAHSEQMAKGCRSFTRKYPIDELPH